MGNIGFFFGAGAERSYGFPAGGEFALDIFRKDVENEKNELKDYLENIKNNYQNYSFYIDYWFPKKFPSLKIYKFDTNDYKNIITSIMENKREKILKILNNLDNFVKENFDKKILEKLKIQDSENYENKIVINENLKSKINIFSSDYFSAILDDYRKYKTKKYKEILLGIMELVIFAAGEDFIEELNNNIIEDKTNDLDFLNDLFGVFKMDYRKFSGINYILKKEKLNHNEINTIYDLSREILENIYINIMDYRNLIDKYFKYLFYPKKNWAKFTKITIFLNSVKNYIEMIYQNNQKKINSKNGYDGYYDDLLSLNDPNIIIGTSNYHNFITEKYGFKNVYHLNGSIEDFYDPFKNSLVKKESLSNYPYLTVPLLFTQSGIKPLTTIEISRRYVEYYNKLKKCEKIIVIGYGFNDDDGHINTLFRKLIEDDNKEITILSFEKEIENIKDLLRIEDDDKVIQYVIDENRNIDDQKWFEFIKSEGN